LEAHVISAAGDVARRVPDALRRPVELIMFDWDGTAVPDRKTAVPHARNHEAGAASAW
jgi:hypothetical protein